jgi:SAM-dependent methyltransferase
MAMSDHDRALARGFDAQAPFFERAPVQSDPVALERLVVEADLPAGGLILDSGCGPGLVGEALLKAGYRLVGVDLSREMIERARRRCSSFGDRARFVQASVFDGSIESLGLFDGAISRYVLHHVVDPPAFLARQIELVRPGGVVVVSDHLTDPHPDRAVEHNAIEVLRDRTHTRNLTGGELVNLFANAGLVGIRLVEESFTLDFDEWFDRGTPSDTKESVRARLLAAPPMRGFCPEARDDGSIRIDGVRAIVRGIKP